MNFQVGDIVQLRSGGPNMTIESCEGDDVRCVWFDGNSREMALFVGATLVKSEGTVGYL
ncbi:uncharacterized protein YodC (DUF2158 family) [Loktanella ponticola]|uniref:Uncharacterized protein YodC (DUF2158 family) n=1 Tax=Yoonia ponticola TaxID=1524255 RepID=A0A7W9BKG6_9RHOB|nr:DUF2158 domain-containing protein [Yoonia ponticola]MBB5722179.1 uncharacterized protein YodC (DUF2158 family) [Yoonia ponticola]